MVWIPSFYTFHSYFFVYHQPTLGSLANIMIFLLGLLSIYYNYNVDRQKELFRTSLDKSVKVWKAIIIVITLIIRFTIFQILKINIFSITISFSLRFGVSLPNIWKWFTKQQMESREKASCCCLGGGAWLAKLITHLSCWLPFSGVSPVGLCSESGRFYTLHSCWPSLFTEFIEVGSYIRN